MRLAELHPRHTWQSWRERWVRNLQPLIGRQIARERKEARDRALAEKAAAGERVEFSDDEEEEVAERKPAPASKRNGGKRVEFSAEDDDILIDTLNQPGMKDTKGNAIFKTIAEQVCVSFAEVFMQGLTGTCLR